MTKNLTPGMKKELQIPDFCKNYKYTTTHRTLSFSINTEKLSYYSDFLGKGLKTSEL